MELNMIKESMALNSHLWFSVYFQAWKNKDSLRQIMSDKFNPRCSFCYLGFLHGLFDMTQ